MGAVRVGGVIHCFSPSIQKLSGGSRKPQVSQLDPHLVSKNRGFCEHRKMETASVWVSSRCRAGEEGVLAHAVSAGVGWSW